jgi:hypothetical protein
MTNKDSDHSFAEIISHQETSSASGTQRSLKKSEIWLSLRY